jgi:hypothetical protein
MIALNFTLGLHRSDPNENGKSFSSGNQKRKRKKKKGISLV